MDFHGIPWRYFTRGRVPFNLRCSTSVAWRKYYTVSKILQIALLRNVFEKRKQCCDPWVWFMRTRPCHHWNEAQQQFYPWTFVGRDAHRLVSKLIKISLYAQARQLPRLQAQSSVWNRLIFLNNYLMLLHKLNEIFRANWTWISDCRASSILKTVPVSQDSKEYAKCKLGEFVHNNTNPLFRIAWHFWPNTKYSGEVSLIISVDIHRESRLTQCVRTLIFSKCRTHWDFTLCSNSTVASTFNPMQYLKSLEISKQISCVLRGIKRAIPRKLVKISDCRVSSFLKSVPGCQVSRRSVF